MVFVIFLKIRVLLTSQSHLLEVSTNLMEVLVKNPLIYLSQVSQGGPEPCIVNTLH